MNLTGAAAAPVSIRLARLVLLATVVAMFLALPGPGVGPAVAHTHPTRVELTEPAVVRVETAVQVNISLIEHDRHGKHIGLYQKTYEPVVTFGSGFAVNPSGVIVAAGGVIEADLRKAEVYAVNHIFHDRYGNRAPLPAKEDTQYTIRNDDPDDPLNGRLQRCYRANTADTTGGCVIATTRLVRVYPYVSSQERYGNLAADVLYPKTGKASVAVLKVGASSMPTVNLAESNAGTADFAAIGFTKIPTEPPSDKGPIVKSNGHLIGDGPDIKKDQFQPKLVSAIAAGIWGGPVVGQTDQTSGFLQVRPIGGGKFVPYMTDVTEIRKALEAARVEASQGPTDAVFEAALHNYNNKSYAAAIPSLEQTVRLYPGHAVATRYLAIAQQRKGTPEDQSGRQSAVKGISTQTDGLPLGPIALVAGALVVLALLLVGPLRRGGLRPDLLRRGGGGGGGGEGSRSRASFQQTPTPPPPAARPEPRTTPREPVDWPRAEAHADTASGRVPIRAPITTFKRPDPAPEPKPEEVGFCTQCGRPLAEEHKFCGFCGHKAR
jgi:hypothetical protein